ncbi:MAG: hypothetical protein ACTHLT_03460 [Devosia sp.]
MKAVVTLAAVALLAASSPAVLAQQSGTTKPNTSAQSAKPNTSEESTERSTSTESTEKETAAKAAASTTGSMGNYGTLISTLEAGKMADLATYKTSAAVHCVKLSSLSEASANKSAIDNALSKNATAVTDLKTKINASAEFKAKLDPTTCPVDKVIAVTEEKDGSFIVYVDDRT